MAVLSHWRAMRRWSAGGRRTGDDVVLPDGDRLRGCRTRACPRDGARFRADTGSSTNWLQAVHSAILTSTRWCSAPVARTTRRSWCCRRASMAMAQGRSAGQRSASVRSSTPDTRRWCTAETTRGCWMCRHMRSLSASTMTSARTRFVRRLIDTVTHRGGVL